MKCFDSVYLGKGLTSLAGLCVKGVALYSFRLCVFKGFKMQSLVRDSFFVGKILRGDLVLIGIIHRSQVFGCVVSSRTSRHQRALTTNGWGSATWSRPL